MKKLLLIFALLWSVCYGQSLLLNDNDALISPFRYIPNDVAAWTAGTGVYANNTADSSIICNTAGIMYIASTQAYGEWYFDLNKTDASTLGVRFINSTNDLGNRYNLVLTNVEAVRIYMDGIIFSTVNAYISHSTWYSFKVTRSSSGIFYLYIRGGAFGNLWTLVKPTGLYTNPVTDNTYTSSLFCVLSFYAGDKIRNVRFKKLNGTYETLILHE